jgi:subtilisin family serine protease
MKRLLKTLVAATSMAMLLAGCALTSTGTGSAQHAPESSARQIVLTIRQDRDTAVQLRGEPNLRYATRRGYGPSPSVERTLNQLAREHGLTRVDGWPIASLDVYCEVFAVGGGVEVDAVIESLREDSRIELVQRMNTFETLVGRYDDPYADLQEALIDLEIAAAHSLATGKGVTVAVIDSSVDTRHPELRGQISVNRDLVGTRPGARGGEIHGTAVAGIIASNVNNTEGIIGIAPDATIAALRACWALEANTSAARCSTFSLALALETAMNLDAQVINLSLTGPFDPLLALLLDAAMERDIVIVAAAPEAGQAPAGFPASHAGVIAVRAANADADGLLDVALPAPGREILTTTPNADYMFLSGNSLAAAHVTGVVALLLEREPAISAARLELVLAESSTGGTPAKSISACRALARLTGAGLCGAVASLAEF